MRRNRSKKTGRTPWNTIVLLGCAFLLVAFVGLHGLDYSIPINLDYSNFIQKSGNQVSNYHSIYRVGSIATDSSGTKGYAIVSDDGNGKYDVIQVYIDQSQKGWHTNGPGVRQSLDYKNVEQQYPTVWSGGIMDITHIPDKDWSLPENWNSGRGSGYGVQNSLQNENSYVKPVPSIVTNTQNSVSSEIEKNNPSYSNQNVLPSSSVPITEILNRHNYYRSAITGANIPNLVWSSSVASSAQKYADYLGANNLFEHSGGPYGENLAAGYGSWTEAIDGWGAEKSNFIYTPFGNGASKTGNWKDVGHYTQIIWKTTTQCGCGSAKHPTWGTVYVCQYSPAGNFVGLTPY